MNGLLETAGAVAAVKYIFSSSPKPPQPDESEKLSQHISEVIASGRSRGRKAVEAEDRRDRQRSLQPKAAPAPEYPLGFCIIWGLLMLFFVVVIVSALVK